MRLRNFVHILLITLALSGYSAWLRTARREAREAGQRPADFPAATFPVLQVPLLRLDDAQALWHRQSTVFLDVRPAFDYQLGHIAGALNLPEGEFDQRFPALRPRLEQAEAIVLYCSSPSCAKSYWSAIRLHNAGLTRLHIYQEGWNEWTTHHLPTARSE